VAFRLARTPLFNIAFYFYETIPRLSPQIKKAQACPDLKKIEREPDSGSVSWFGEQKLHHGIKVIAGSYFGPEYCLLMKATKGVHEPQEEFAFQEVLKRMHQAHSSFFPHILELGAFWGFYSTWFLKTFPNADALLIEPEPFNIVSGMNNCKMNNVERRVSIKRAFISDIQAKQLCDCPILNVDSLGYLKTKKQISILHSDIQGHELAMLTGAKQCFEMKLIRYIFISTHSNSLHKECLKKIKQYNCHVLAEHNVCESFSNDGLIVAAANHVGDLQPIQISKKNINKIC
jgi:hypothetical protein